MSMLEVVKPAAKHGVSILDDLCQAVPTRAFGLHPDALTQRFKTLGPYPAPPRLEAITEKLKTLPGLPTVSHVGLVSIKPKPVLFDPGSHFVERSLRLFSRAAKHHEVIGVAHHAVTLPFHMPVQGMKIDIGQKRADHRSLRRASHRRPSPHPLDDVLVQKSTDQLQHCAVANPLRDLTHQRLIRDTVEVAVKVGIHHVGVAVLDQPLYFPQRVFAAPTRTKAVTRLLKLSLKDRFDHQLQCRLHDAVFDHGNPQRAHLAAPFGNLHAPYRLWPVLSRPKRSLKFFQIDFCPCLKLLHALPIPPRRSGVVLYFLPRRLKRLLSVHLVYQAKPFPSFDAVFQRRQHVLAPHRGFYPRPVSALDFCALCSPCGHCRRLAFALPRCVAHASTFLPPVPRRSFALCASRGVLFPPLRYHEGSDSYAAHLRRRSPRLPRHTFLSFRLQPRELPGHRFPPRQRDQLVSDFAMNEQARRSSPPNRVLYLRTNSSPPVALHAASSQRSYLRLRSCGLLRHGLPPRKCGALTGAPIPACAGMTSRGGHHVEGNPSIFILGGRA